MNDHLQISSEIEDEVENNQDFELIEAMKCLGRNYINKIKDDISPTFEQRVATVLNPRMKRLRRMNNSERDEIYEKIDTLIKNEVSAPTVTQSKLPQRNKKRTSLDDFMDSDDETTDSLFEIEFSKYLKYQVSDDTTDLRKWWFNHRNVFPALFKIFMRISSIPASSSPSERTFSTTGAIITDRRSALLPKSVENIMLVRNLYRT